MANIDSTASNTDRMREHLFLKQMRGPPHHEQEEDLSMCSNVVNFRLSVCLNGLEPPEKKKTTASITASSPCLSLPMSSASHAIGGGLTTTDGSKSEAGGATAVGEKIAGTTAEEAPAISGAAAQHPNAVPGSDAHTSGDTAVNAEDHTSAAECDATTVVCKKGAADDKKSAVSAVEAEVPRGVAAASDAVSTDGKDKEAVGDRELAEETERDALRHEEKERDSQTREGGGKTMEKKEDTKNDGGDDKVNTNKEKKSSPDKGEHSKPNDSGVSPREGASLSVTAAGGGTSSSQSNEEEEEIKHAKAVEGGEVATLKDVLLANPTDKCLVSDVDEQMLINIFFNSPVRITSIAIRSTVPPPDFEWKRKTGEEDEEEELPEDGTVAEPKVIKHGGGRNARAGTHADTAAAERRREAAAARK